MSTSVLIWDAEVISLQRSSVQSSMAFSESISTVNLSFSTIRNIFDRLSFGTAGHESRRRRRLRLCCRGLPVSLDVQEFRNGDRRGWPGPQARPSGRGRPGRWPRTPRRAGRPGASCAAGGPPPVQEPPGPDSPPAPDRRPRSYEKKISAVIRMAVYLLGLEGPLTD